MIYPRLSLPTAPQDAHPRKVTPPDIAPTSSNASMTCKTHRNTNMAPVARPRLLAHIAKAARTSPAMPIMSYPLPLLLSSV